MPLSPNSKIGPYEIKSSLGVGGMGEVYRARDSRLNRDVAIKVLRQDSASGSSGASADLRSRFEREARAVAALNHPNIIAVYDFGIEGGQQYIVSELLEGESLRSLLKGKPLLVRRLIEIGAQIADGLAASHCAGIVHRDLKPENVMLTKDGRAKILDFGLARHAPTTPPGSARSSDETFIPPTLNLTSAGAVLGTAAYMSPEQALGQETDCRSDQFSFGVILYEMASGKQAFAKPSSVETMAAIVRDDPPSMEEKLPAPLRWIIDRCLAKEADRRYESTRDLYRDLVDLRDHFTEAYSSENFAAVPIKARPRPWRLFGGLAAGGLALGVLSTVLLTPVGQDLSKHKYTPFAADAWGAFWSPDGKALAYSANVNGIYQIFLRYLNSPTSIQLTHEKQNLFVEGWSHDKAHLIVSATKQNEDGNTCELYSVSTVGGDAESIMGYPSCDDDSLAPNGTAFVTLIKDNAGYERLAVSDPVGSPLKVYTPDPWASKENYSNSAVVFSPDAKTILYFRTGESGVGEVWLLPYPSTRGKPRRVLKDFLFVQTYNFSWMPDGRHLLLSDRNSFGGSPHLWMADTSSSEKLQLTTGIGYELGPQASPDGKTIIYAQKATLYEAVSVSVENGSTKTEISNGNLNAGASWSANNPKLAWATDRNGPTELWVRNADASEHPVVSFADFPPGDTVSLSNPALSPDGGRLIYNRWDNKTARLWISSLSGGSPIRLTNSETGDEHNGSWSPDGTRFAYLKTHAGNTSLMTVKTRGGAAPAILKDGIEGRSIAWSPTGKWIAYADEQRLEPDLARWQDHNISGQNTNPGADLL
jgi:serine/threonine protein kinase